MAFFLLIIQIQYFFHPATFTYFNDVARTQTCWKQNTKANILAGEWVFPADFLRILYGTVRFFPALHSVISLFMLAKVENKHKFHSAASSISLPSVFALFFLWKLPTARQHILSTHQGKHTDTLKHRYKPIQAHLHTLTPVWQDASFSALGLCT